MIRLDTIRNIDNSRLRPNVNSNLIISLLTPSRQPLLTLTAAAGVLSLEIDWCISLAPHVVQKKPFVSPLLFGLEYVAIAPGNGEGKMAVMP